MPKTISGKLDAAALKIGIVVARFNDFVTGKLLDGAVDAIVRHNGREDAVTAVWVPGSFELPLAARKMAESGRFDAIVCLGCLIRGQTPHFDYVAGEAAKGIAGVSLQTGVPISFGVITADNLEQAIDRAGGKAGNKGVDAALAAIEMCNVLTALSK